MKILRRTRFGNPILRTPAKPLTKKEILSADIQTLIADMQHTLKTKPYGVGLAAPQIGRSLALSVIAIKPTPTRPKNRPFNAIIINPKIVQSYGRRSSLWEGCISFGIGADLPYAKALRYKKIRVAYLDERANLHEADFNGLGAQVLQHEIDHLNGVLFVDRVRDNKTFITIQEYKKHYLPKAKSAKQS